MPISIGRASALVHACTCVLRSCFQSARFLLVGILLGCLTTTGATAVAQELMLFDIPAGPAERSLNAYAQQAGIEIGFAIEEVSSVHTNAVKGRYSADVALDRLLKGTELVVTSRSNGLTVARDATRSAADRVGPDRNAPGNTQGRSAARVVNSESAISGNDEPSAGHPSDRKQPMEEILVTGSHIRGVTHASPVVSLTRDDIDRGGFSTVGEVIENLPQNFGVGATQESLTDRSANDAVGGSVDNIAGGQSINLRGLGAGSTLVLLNGRRLSPSGLSARFTDVSRIPLSAIERVDVLTDGASAIYGSDAIGGVVNFVLRETYDGAETRVKYGSDTAGHASEILASQAAGTSWPSGSILASYEYYHRDNLPNRYRSFAASSNLVPLGGTDWREPGGNPANIEAGGQTYAIPNGQNGASLTPADFSSNRDLNLHDFRAAEDLLPSQEHHSLFVNLVQQVGRAELFTQAHLSRQETEYRIDQPLISFDVPDTNPFFVDPSSSGLSSIFVGDYSLVADLGPNIGTGESQSDGAVAGIRLDISESWSAELAANWSREKSIQNIRNSLNEVAFERALGSPDPGSAFNPFADGSNTNPDVLSGLTTDTGGYTAEQELAALEVSFDGEAFSMPSGEQVRVATGLEFREESLDTELREGAEIEMPTVIPGLSSSRDIFAGYAEFFVPIRGSVEPGSPKGRLEVSLAARYEHYSDFGDTTDPKVGIVWSPTGAVTLRGTFGTSFRAPALWDLDTTAPGNSIILLAQEFVDAGFIPFTALIQRGGNEHLKPEEATTWTAGIEFSPESLRELSVDVTYFDVDFKNRIDLPFVSLFDGFLPRFSSLMTINPTLEQITVLASDPRYRESVFGTTTPAEDLISGAVEVGAIINARRNNISKSKVTGLELQAEYEKETRIGKFNVGVNGSYLFDFQRALLATDAPVEELDTLGRPVDFRLRTSLTWIGEAWSVSGHLNYVDSYTDQNSEPDRPVASWSTVDLTIAYDVPFDGGLLSSTTLSLSARNVLDRDPPFVDAFGAPGYDSANANGLGRFISMQLAKDW